MHDDMDGGGDGDGDWGRLGESGGGSCYAKGGTKQEKKGKGHDRPHLLDAQLIHWVVRLPAVLEVAKVSELRTESVSMFFIASADPDERRGELGTDRGGSIEGERDISVIDISDVALVMVGGEEGTDKE